MNTSLAHVWGQMTADNPLLAHPAALHLVSSEVIFMLVKHGFYCGVERSQDVQQQLKALADRDAAERAYQAAIEPQCPADLKPHFDDIFGPRRPAA